MKVYCGDCRSVRSWSDCMGGVYIECVMAKVKSYTDSPEGRSCIKQTCEDRNKNNNCGDFVKAKWWQKIWANTCG